MRIAKVNRKTKETDILFELNLDGEGISEINTGIGFFDHMLTQIATHGKINLKIIAKGDLNVDSHHTIEDVGIVFGLALKEALKDKLSITRYGEAFIPMDEALVMCAIDISNRGYAEIACPFKMENLGEFPLDMLSEFFKALANNAGLNIHSLVFRGKNAHHVVEATFKAFAKALNQAITPTNTSNTTKGFL